MTEPTVITGDEVTAFTENLLALTPCTTCGGGIALVIEHDTVSPQVLHDTDCGALIAVDLDRHLNLILGGGNKS
jgi:hypothetical protein